MKRSEAKSVGEIINELLKEQNLEDKLCEHKALDLWPKVVGPLINQRTVERRVDRGILYVRITSAPIRQELSINKTSLLATLNKAVGKDVLKEIRFI